MELSLLWSYIHVQSSLLFTTFVQWGISLIRHPPPSPIVIFTVLFFVLVLILTLSPSPSPCAFKCCRGPAICTVGRWRQPSGTPIGCGVSMGRCCTPPPACTFPSFHVLGHIGGSRAPRGPPLTEASYLGWAHECAWRWQ